MNKKEKKLNKILWENLHNKSQFLPRYPHERVIQFIFSNFPKNEPKKFKILDYGCGGGRHTVFLAENNYKTYSTDISESGMKFTKKILEKRKLKAKLQNILENKLDYPDNYFDGIICFGVLYYLDYKQLEITIPELCRILKKNGKILVVLRSKRDYRFKFAKNINENGDYLIKGDKRTRVNNENNMLMHFFTKKEIEIRFSKFKKISIDEMLNTYNNKKTIDHDYVIELEK